MIMEKIESHKHFWWGENHQHFDEQESIFKLSEPRVFIRYNIVDSYFSDFEEFYNSIVKVQWIDGKPSEKEQMEILTDAWNFLVIEERLLEEDLEDIEIDDNLDW